MVIDVTGAKHSSFCPRIKIVPNRGLVDETVQIQLSGFKPYRHVTVSALMKDEKGREWKSQATFKVGMNGRVNTASQKPLSGTYEGIDPAGLIWSMSLSSDQKEVTSFMKATLVPLTMNVTATADGQPVASASCERLFMAPEIVRTPVRDDGLVGTFFHNSDSEPRPSVMVLSGSGGGVLETYAALLASRGYSTLALAYFAMENLPNELANIPLEYFEKAIKWVQAQDTVLPDKLAVMGWSRGGELSLLLGATFKEVKAVVAFVPSSVIWGGVTRNGDMKPSWTYRGEPLPFMPSTITSSDRVDFDQRTRAGIPIRETPYFLRAMRDKPAAERARIPVERTNGPILLISGEDDQLWPSTYFSEQVMDRLAQQNHPYPSVHLSYPGAGHMIRPGCIPKTFTVIIHPIDGGRYELGGNAKDDAFASSNSWSKTLEFLAKHLKR